MYAEWNPSTTQALDIDIIICIIGIVLSSAIGTHAHLINRIEWARHVQPVIFQIRDDLSQLGLLVMLTTYFYGFVMYLSCLQYFN